MGTSTQSGRSVPNAALLKDLHERFRQAANARNALPMQQYMKSSMPFLGIQANTRRKIEQAVFARHSIKTTIELIATANALWQDASYREERYAAIDLPAHKSFGKLESLECLAMYQSWIQDGAWWDYCDDISGNRIASLLRTYPAEMKRHLLRWARSRDIWLRRAAIICQRTMKANTDAHLLYACIMPSITSEEFFLRKGIGWALRARSYVAPDEVLAFVKEYGDVLSPLTQREALKVTSRRSKATLS